MAVLADLSPHHRHKPVASLTGSPVGLHRRDACYAVSHIEPTDARAFST
jgi:hypothetical protein